MNLRERKWKSHVKHMPLSKFPIDYPALLSKYVAKTIGYSP